MRTISVWLLLVAADDALLESTTACETSAKQSADFACDELPTLPRAECVTIATALMTVCDDAAADLGDHADWTLGYRPAYPDASPPPNLADRPALALFSGGDAGGGEEARPEAAIDPTRATTA